MDLSEDEDSRKGGLNLAVRLGHQFQSSPGRRLRMATPFKSIWSHASFAIELRDAVQSFAWSIASELSAVNRRLFSPTPRRREKITRIVPILFQTTSDGRRAMINGRLMNTSGRNYDVQTSPPFFCSPSVENDVAHRVKTKTQADLFKTKTYKVRPSLFFVLPSIGSDEPDQIKAEIK